jgi:hypothetical protein
MSLYHNSKHKLRNLYRTIDALLDGDFPISSGKNALYKLREIFEEQEKRLDRAKRLADNQTERQIANIVNIKIYQTLPILGFILRSTNVRNAFELLDPLQHLADAVLQGRPQLLLSCEWDYVPFAYPQSLEDLRSFVLIGLPASEAATALLIPLAGHELGHAVWRNRGVGGSAIGILQDRCEQSFRNNMPEFNKYFPEYDAADIVYREVLPETIVKTVEYAVFQAEEIFCDMFAYAVFGESYLHAFSYILAPGSGRSRTSMYPSYSMRISVLKDVAAKEGVHLPGTDALDFIDERPRQNPRDRFIARMAEKSVTELISELWQNLTSLLSAGTVPRPNPTLSARHLREFRIGIPAHQPVCLGDIINAGWAYYGELQSLSESEIAVKTDYLNEMVLKTIEVLEYRRRVLA